MKKLLFLFALVPGIAMAQNSPTTKLVSASPTADTSAYATGELIGEKLTFSGALNSSTGAGYIISAAISDKAAQAVDLELVVFGQDPSNTTFTDQAAFDIADADLSKIVAVISFGSATRFAYADNGYKYLGSLMLPVNSSNSSGVASNVLYGALLSRGTPTFASSSDLTVILGINRDK